MRRPNKDYLTDLSVSEARWYRNDSLVLVIRQGNEHVDDASAGLRRSGADTSTRGYEK
jgi:hypothetical protein